MLKRQYSFKKLSLFLESLLKEKFYSQLLNNSRFNVVFDPKNITKFS